MSPTRQRKRKPTAAPPRRNDRRVLPVLLGVGVIASCVALVAFAVTRRERAVSFVDTAEDARTGWEVPDPVTVDMQSQVGQLLAEARDGVRAIPTSDEAWGRLGRACDAHELHEYAETCYRQARKLAPLDFRYPYLLARSLYAQGEAGDESFALYQEAARLNPDYAPIHYQLGLAYARRGDPEASLVSFQRAVELDPECGAALRHIGQLHLSLGKPEEAVQYLERSVETGPPDRASYATLSQVLFRLGRTAEAESAAAQARRLHDVYGISDPVVRQVTGLASNSTAAFNRAKRFMRSGDYAGAIMDLKIYADVHPGNADVRVDLGMCYRRIGQYELAEAALNDARRSDPKSPLPLIELAILAFEREDPGAGLSWLEQAASIAPKDQMTQVKIAHELVRKRYPELAIDAFERAAGLGSLSPRNHLVWGALLFQVERYEEAIAQYDAVLAQEPANTEARRYRRAAERKLGR